MNKGKTHCCLFEGFIDYLSFLSLKGIQSIESNVIILNSVNNLNKATEFLKRHDTIYTFLDNDEAGRKCLNEIRKLDKTVSDQSQTYSGYKDLNDYLCGKKQVQQKQPKRGMRF
ncbi:MAG: toprim domain-containing protein [Tannerella sp.]|nr:toprim domain-containing protein [Tannerella sp.]